MLGPMVNPGRPQNQIIGVFNLELARMYNYLYQKSGINYCVVHSLDGYDEISLTGNFKALTNSSEKIISPAEIGMPELKPEELAGTGEIPGTADIFMKVLNGKGTRAQNSVVITNSAMALSTYFPKKELCQCIENARLSLMEGEALKVFNKLISLQ
jgi:anthranilate phosphoribosyltransferase